MTLSTATKEKQVGFILIIAGAVITFIGFLLRLMLIKGSNDMELFLEEAKSSEEMLPEMPGNKYFSLLINRGVSTKKQLNGLLERGNAGYREHSPTLTIFKIIAISVFTLLFVLWFMLLIVNSGNNDVNMVFFGVIFCLAAAVGAFYSITVEIRRRQSIADAYLKGIRP